MAVAILRTPGFIKKRTNDDDDDDEAEAMIASFQSPSLRFVATVATSPTRGGCFPLIKLRTRVLCKEKVHPPFPASHFPSHHLPQPLTDIKSCASLSHSPTRLSRVYREAFLILSPLHVVSPPLLQDSMMNACHRGCRLYSICQFVNGNAGFNTSKEECQGGEPTMEAN